MPIGFPRAVFGALVLAGCAASLSAQAPGGPAAAARAQEKAAAQSAAAQAALIANLNAIGFAQLDARVAKIAAIATRADAERRQRDVRQAVVDLVGGVPRPAAGPVVATRFGTVDDDGFRIENIAYESLPGYWVTANVYVPAGKGPFPALVVAPGHGAGKASQYGWAANFARAGFLTLAIDPMGHGERMQHFDPELGASKVEPSGEHEHGNQTALLVGQHIARYWFADGVRSVDYLTQRADVDAARIGTFGCSGGGTAAAYLAAMDPRVKAAAIASFITSFKTLMPGNGPQDAEQTLPRFIASGFDFADWVELAAPRPVAIVAFETDFFPIAGAKDTFEEAKRFYGLFGAADAVQLIHGQGGHCNLGPVSPQVFAFLTAHLKGVGASVATFTPARAKNPDALTVTAVASAAAVDALRSRIARDVRSLASVTATPGGSPKVDRSAISVYGTGALGMVALHATALDARISRLVVERGLVSYAAALQAGLHKNLSEALIPSVLTRYDTPDLLIATHPRPVVLVNPANPMGQPEREANVRKALQRAFDTDTALRTPDRIRIARRGFGDPFPLE